MSIYQPTLQEERETKDDLHVAFKNALSISSRHKAGRNFHSALDIINNYVVFALCDLSAEDSQSIPARHVNCPTLDFSQDTSSHTLHGFLSYHASTSSTLTTGANQVRLRILSAYLEILESEAEGAGTDDEDEDDSIVGWPAIPIKGLPSSSDFDNLDVSGTAATLGFRGYASFSFSVAVGLQRQKCEGFVVSFVALVHSILAETELRLKALNIPEAVTAASSRASL
ncbi:hypothetical protein C8J57DRAFT_1238622 [Mycena rebaudengoi]|nr:hypothetical protein C8J57DRAFT_1238622 [Mycena rebaudengoi]